MAPGGARLLGIYARNSTEPEPFLWLHKNHIETNHCSDRQKNETNSWSRDPMKAQIAPEEATQPPASVVYLQTGLGSPWNNLMSFNKGFL